ncbi:MAG: hypothetical protein D6729_03290 [Deltaproteobacteria bacterium]|nr:MAG: hypothetical protein D6729_03290 [Deltaproteobacteria bacterium]
MNPPHLWVGFALLASLASLAAAGGPGRIAPAVPGRPVAAPPRASPVPSEAKDADAQSLDPGDLKLHLPNLEGAMEAPPVPKADDLETQRTSEAPVKKAKVRFSLRAVRHARGFRMHNRRCVAIDPFEVLKAARIPGRVDGFSTCLSLSATQPVTAKVALTLRDPAGRAVAWAEGMVPFGRLGKETDYVVEWEGFFVRRPGTYRMEVRVGTTEMPEHTIRVEGAEP